MSHLFFGFHPGDWVAIALDQELYSAHSDPDRPFRLLRPETARQERDDLHLVGGSGTRDACDQLRAFLTPVLSTSISLSSDRPSALMLL